LASSEEVTAASGKSATGKSASREQVQALLDEGLDYEAVGERLGIPPGQAYLIATGMPADGADAPPDQGSRRGVLPTSQHLANPPYENPTRSELVHDWIAARVAGDAQMREAGARRTAEPAPPRRGNSEEDDEQVSHEVTIVLTRQHNQAHALLRQLAALPGHKNGGAPEDLRARKAIVDMVTIMLAQHETAEEEYFWPAVRKVLRDGDGLADQGLRQEREGTDTLAELGGLAPDTDEFDEHAEQFIAASAKHVAFEERVFAQLREAMPEDERERLGREIEAAARRGRA